VPTFDFAKKMLDVFKTTGHITHMPKPNVRDRLLAASLATLHGKGFNATSVQDITDAAGVPKGSFYNHFASKEILGAEVLALYSDNNRAGFAPLGDLSIAPLERLRRHFETMIVLASGDGRFPGCILGNFANELSTQSPMIREKVAASLQRWSDAVATAIADAQHGGDIADDMPAAMLATFVVNAWQGSLVRAKAEQDRAPLDLFLTTVFKKILR
jgi:TetR/AcrR family transcriptional repressor of nem operon